MTSSFETALAAWHDFFVLVGAGAFTLIGLMFVAVTFGAKVITPKNIGMARAFLDPTVIHFVQLMLITCLILVPHVGPSLLGGALVVLGALSMISLKSVYKILRAANEKYNDFEVEDWISGVVIPFAAYLGFIGCGIAFYQGQPVFGELAAVAILLLLNSVYSAWELILWLAMTSPSAPPAYPRTKRREKT